MLTLVEKKIAVIPLEEPDQIGHIIVVDQAKQRTNQGIVKYVAPGVSSDIQVGDHVLFGGYEGVVAHLEGEGKLIIIEEHFIQAIIHDEVLQVPGLWLKLKDGTEAPATFEIAMSLCQKAFMESDRFQTQMFYRKKKHG